MAGSGGSLSECARCCAGLLVWWASGGGTLAGAVAPFRQGCVLGTGVSKMEGLLGEGRGPGQNFRHRPPGSRQRTWASLGNAAVELC